MSYTCPKCGATSHNPNDERARFCARCGKYTPDDERLIDVIMSLGTPGEPLKVSITTVKRGRQWWAVLVCNTVELLERGPFLNRPTAERAQRKLAASIDLAGIAKKIATEEGQSMGTQPTVEHFQATQCAHVERGESPPVTLARLEPLPESEADFPEQPSFRSVVCALCSGRAAGALFAGDCELPGDRAAVVAAGMRIGDALHVAGLEPSHELALALIEIGMKMAHQLGKRP